MARNHATLTAPSAIALAAGVAKTVMQLTAPANVIDVVHGIDVTFDGTSSSAVPTIIKIVRQTTAGTMTAQAPKKTKDTSTALGSTGAINATAEPTEGDVLLTFHVHPQAGVLMPLPLENEIEVPGGQRLGIVVIAPAAVNCLPSMKIEE